jgi:hypothetical protein
VAEQVRANLALFEVADEDAFRPPGQQPRESVLAQMQRQLAEVVAVERQNIEGVEHHLVIVSAGMQAVEIGDAVNAEQDRLAIDNERAFPVPQRCLRDQGIPGRSNRGRCG